MKPILKLLLFCITATGFVQAQNTSAASKKALEGTQPPPATKMEAFQPSAGSVVTFGYDELGRIAGVQVDVRELRDSKGSVVRGLLVKVTESEYRNESSFVDTDEIAELLKGFDSLLQISANPTQFKNFEVRYKTKGGLELTAFNDSRGSIEYAVSAGRFSTAQSLGLTAKQMQDLRAKFAAAQSKLASLSAAS